MKNLYQLDDLDWEIYLLCNPDLKKNNMTIGNELSLKHFKNCHCLNIDSVTNNLLKHSLSIISVFRKTVLIRSALFIVFYILLIKSNASIITSLPLVLLLVMIYAISSLALRENMSEFEKCLDNIHDIDKIK